MAMRRKIDFASGTAKAIKGASALPELLRELETRGLPDLGTAYCGGLEREALLGENTADLEPQLAGLARQLSSTIAAAVRHRPQELLAAVHTRYGFIEQRAFHTFLSHVVKNGITLCHLSHWLALVNYFTADGQMHEFDPLDFLALLSCSEQLNHGPIEPPPTPGKILPASGAHRFQSR